MGKIQKASEEQNIDIFKAIFDKHIPLKNRACEIKQAKANKQRDRFWETTSTSSKLSHNTPDEVDLVRTGKSIRSARCASNGITNEGGSGNQIGASRHSVANADFLAKIASLPTSKECTKEEKRASKNIRSLKQTEYKESQQMRVGEEEIDQLSKKSSSIASSRVDQRGRYIPPLGKISIFDNSDYERLQPTAGELMEKREYKKDTSWQQVKKAQTITDTSSKAFDDLSSQSQDNGYKNLHQSSVDRIFNAIINNTNKNGS